MNRVDIGRNVKTCSGTAHLMVVDKGLWNPVTIDQLCKKPCFFLSELESVSVVIMTGVIMVKVRQASVVVIRVFVFIEPFGHQNLAVRIKAGDHEKDRILEYHFDR